MSNATQPADQNLCPDFPGWCDVPDDGHTEHHGGPDMPPVCATAERSDLSESAGGVEAPRIKVSVWASTEYYPDDSPQITLTLLKPNGTEAEAHMTVAEADFLRRHLVQAVSAVRSEVAS